MKKENLGLISIIACGIILIAIVSFVIIKSNQTVKVWVPNKDLPTGHVISEEDIKQIDVPVNTPKEYIANKEMIVGFKLKNGKSKNQFFYPNDFLGDWQSYSDDKDIPEDFVITSIQVPDERAVGGLIVAGDTIDILGVSNDGQKIGFEQVNPHVEGRDGIGTNVYYILSNVKVINTNSSLSKAQENSMSDVIEDSSGEGSYYLIALSYEDLKKLRQAEGMFDLWLNIAPKQNEENPPLISQMIGQSFSGLHDAQKPVQDKEGKPIDENLKIDTDQKQDKNDGSGADGGEEQENQAEEQQEGSEN